MSKVSITAVIVCDDIRKEVTGKDILIGVYSGDIIVQDIPATISAAFWFELLPLELGVQRLELRLRLANKEEALPLTIEVQVENLSPSAIFTPSATITVDAETELLLEERVGESWRVLKSKKIYKGKVNHPLIFSNDPQPPV